MPTGRAHPAPKSLPPARFGACTRRKPDGRSAFALALPRVGVLLAAAGLALAAGCASSPFDEASEDGLRQAIMQAANRELEDSKAHPESIVVERASRTAQLQMSPELVQQLEGRAGPRAYGNIAPALSEDLMGLPARTVSVSLERLIKTAVERNLAVQFARLGPAIAEAQVVSAEAAFDWVFFASSNYTNTDQPRSSSSINNSSFGSAFDQSQAVTQSLGLRRNTIGGGRFTFQHEFSYTDNQTPRLRVRPNPANQPNFLLQFDQPLLKGFGSEVSQAEIRIARNAERNAIHTLKRDLLKIVQDTESAYWQLEQSYADLLILQRLLENGVEVADIVSKRRDIDANDAQIADADARIQRRKADVLRAQTQLRLVSDRLKNLVNDPTLPVGSEIVLLPADRAVDAPIKFSMFESVRSAIHYRPEVQQAITGIDDAGIRQIVADNARLPDLNLRLQGATRTLDNTAGEAYADLSEFRFVDYVVGLVFERPIGNRKGEADFVRRRLERMQSVIAYRNTVQQVVGEVKASLDRVVLNYKLINQTRDSRLSATNSLRVLEIENESDGFTVERLDLRLNRQESVANAEREEFRALVDYNIAISDLFAAMGTGLERNGIRFIVPTSADVSFKPVLPTGWEYRTSPNPESTMPASSVPPPSVAPATSEPATSVPARGGPGDAVQGDGVPEPAPEPVAPQ